MRPTWARWRCPPIPDSATSNEFTPWRAISLATVTPASKRAALINADVGIAAVRLGDVASSLTYGQRSLEAVRTSETSFGLWRLEELARALAQEPRARELPSEIRQARRALASQT
jgi:hypothetical protein